MDKISQYQTINNQTQKCILQANEFQEQITMIEKAAIIVNDVNNVLCQQIFNGILVINEDQGEFMIQRKSCPIRRNLSIQKKLQEVNTEEHLEKVRLLMQISRRFRKRQNNRTLQFQNSLKIQNEQQNRDKQEQKAKQLEKRRQLIEHRMTSKSQMMTKIKKMSLQSIQRVQSIKKKKFLYQYKQQIFRSKVLLPKIQQQKRILQNIKDRMKSIDMNELNQHQKSYGKRKQNQRINRSMTSRMIKSQIQYNPPQYVPKSYLILEAQQALGRQRQFLKAKQAQNNRLKLKQFVKNVSQLHKMQHQIQNSRTPSPRSIFLGKEMQKQLQEQTKPKRSKAKPKLTRQQATKVGNQYFKSLQEQIKAVKSKRERVKRQRQQEQRRQKHQQEGNKSKEQQLQIEIRTEQTRTIHKIQTIQRVHKIRSRRIQSIFNDTTIDPLLKHQKLKHEVQRLDRTLMSKNCESEDITQMTEAAGCYLGAIKAKLKLLEVSNPN